MKTVSKMVLTLAAILSMATVASAATDKLIVNDANGKNVFKVDDTGSISGQYWNATTGKYVINSYFNPLTKKYGFGTSSPQTSFHTVEENADAQRGVTIGQHFTGNAAAVIAINRSGGTEAAPTMLANGQNIAAFHAKPYDGTPVTVGVYPSYTATASLIWTVDGAVSTGNTPTATTFWNGGTATNRLERMRISSDGRLRMSNQPAAPANNAACTVGDLIFDAPNGYLYMCVATNSWKRVAFSAY